MLSVHNAGRETVNAFVGASSLAMVGRQASGVEGLKLDVGRKAKDAFVRTRTASEQVTPLKSDVRPIANRHARAGAITEGSDSPLPLFTTSRSITQ